MPPGYFEQHKVQYRQYSRIMIIPVKIAESSTVIVSWLFAAAIARLLINGIENRIVSMAAIEHKEYGLHCSSMISMASLTTLTMSSLHIA